MVHYLNGLQKELPNQQHAKYTFGLTSGNGSKDIMIIIGGGECLNLEEFAVSDTPRNGRPWEKFSKQLIARARNSGDGSLSFHRNGHILRDANEIHGLPVGFWITLTMTIVQSILWLMLLITVASVRNNTWYLLAVGGIGMFQNGIVAAIERPPESRNLPLKFVATIERRKVMDGLMDLECALRVRMAPVQGVFTGELTKDEKEWWDGNREAYDTKRDSQADRRGQPGRRTIHELIRRQTHDL